MARWTNDYDWINEDFFENNKLFGILDGDRYIRIDEINDKLGIGMLLMGEEGMDYLARMMMIADGNSMESTLTTDRDHASLRREYGQKVNTLLVECVNEAEKNESLEEGKRDYTKRNELNDYYNRAVEKFKTITYPDIDYTNVDEVLKHREVMHAWTGLQSGFEKIMNPKSAWYTDETRQMIEIDRLIYERTIELDNPPNPKAVEQMLMADIRLSQFGDRIKGRTFDQYNDQNKSSRKVAHQQAMYEVVAAVSEGPDNLKRCADYLNGERDAVCPYYIEGDEIKVSPSYDSAFGRSSVYVNLRESQSEYEAGNYEAVFDKMLAAEPDVPDAHSEVPEKRIYIDGKNAYDEFSKKHPEIQNEAELSKAVKADIVKSLTEGKKRVEFVRMERSHDGLPVATVVPIQADLTMLDEKKKWYQTSFVKRADALWSNDKNQEERQRAIKEQAERKQGEHLLEVLHPTNSIYYKRTLERRDESLKEARDPEQGGTENFDEIANALNRDPKETAEWIKLKDEESVGREKQPPVQLDQEKQNRLRELDGKILGMQLPENAGLEDRMRYHKLEEDFLRVREALVKADKDVFMQSLSMSSERDEILDIHRPEKVREYLRAGKSLAENYGLTDADLQDYLRNGASEKDAKNLTSCLEWRDSILKQGDHAPVAEAYKKDTGVYDISPELMGLSALYYAARQYKTYKKDFTAVDPSQNSIAYAQYLDKRGEELNQEAARAAAQRPGTQVPFADFAQQTTAAEPRAEIPVAGTQNSMSIPANSQEMRH